MLISIGDFIDLYFQFVQKRGPGNLLLRLFMNNSSRTQTWWNAAASGTRSWWDIPGIAARWNSMISGDASIHFMRFVGTALVPQNRPFRLLSIGCGEGQKELAIARMWPAWQITGFDTSQSRIEKAKNAAQSGQFGNISFFVNDIGDWRCSPGSFDAVLFDSSLHHFCSFDLLFQKVKNALAADGLLIINEYVGPDRFNWTKQQLDAANRLLGAIPPRYRTRWNTSSVKKRIYRPGYLRMLLSDPSEAMHSSRIIPSIHAGFLTVNEVPLGGNLLHLLLKDIAHHFREDDDDARKILESLCSEEDAFLQDNKSDFMFGIYKKQ